MKKIGRNEMCPCGSGKKYKHCCLVREKDLARKELMDDFYDSISKNKPATTVNLNGDQVKIPRKDEIHFDYRSSHMPESGFVKRRLDEDILAMSFLLSHILYSTNKKAFEFDKLNDRNDRSVDEIVREYVQEDYLGEIKRIKKEIDNKAGLKGLIKPFVTYSLTENIDAVSLYKEGKISIYQVLVFHYYLLEWIFDRFNEYRYIPASDEIEGNLYGLNQHRGFDYILAIAINIEIQLGIHIIINDYLGEKGINNITGDDLYFSELQEAIGPITLDKLQIGSKYIILSYYHVLDRIDKDYSPTDELLALYKQSTMHELDCIERLETLSKEKRQLSGYYYDYISALKCMCIALIHEAYARGGLLEHSLRICSQIDYIKTIFGINELQFQFNKDYEEYFKVSEQGRIDEYHAAVFYFLDEKNGLANGLYPDDLEYMDFELEVDSLEPTHEKYYLKNPAINEIYYFDHNFFRLDVYEYLEGRFLPIKYKEEIVCAVPLMPFVFKRGAIEVEELQETREPRHSIYDRSMRIRQEIIKIFMVVTDIEASEIREYLKPVVFFNWLENNKLKQQLLKQDKIIEQLRKDLANEINSDIEEVRESALSKFQNDAVATLGNMEEEFLSVDEFESCKDEIISFISENVWHKLKDESKKYLVTSRITFKRMLEIDSMDDLDYSGVCLLITKAIDVEVFRRFFQSYRDYLRNKYKNDYSKWPKEMLNEKKTKALKENKVTLGSIIHIMGLSNDGKTITVNREKDFNEFVSFASAKMLPSMSINDVKIKLIEYAEYIETAREEYRNKTAHRNEMNQKKAKACNDYVIERIRIIRKILEPLEF